MALLGLNALVSLTDHDNIDAPLGVRALDECRNIPSQINIANPIAFGSGRISKRSCRITSTTVAVGGGGVNASFIFATIGGPFPDDAFP
jgi:hypothetical protein